MHKSSPKHVVFSRCGITIQKFDVDFSVAHARIDCPQALLAAFAACLKADADGRLHIDVERRHALLQQCVLQEEKPLYACVYAGKLLITSETWYQTPQETRETSFDELLHLNPNHKLLVIERWSKDGKHKGLQLLGGRAAEADTMVADSLIYRQALAVDAVNQKLSFMNGFRVPAITPEERSQLQRRLSGIINLDPHFVKNAILSKTALDNLVRSHRLAPRVISFYEQALSDNRNGRHAKEIHSLEFSMCDSFALQVPSTRLLEWVDNDQRFYRSAKGARVRLRIVSLLDALYPQAWLDQHEFYHAIVQELFETLGRNPVVFRAYLRQATHRIMQVMRADILAGRFPEDIALQQPVADVLSQWLTYVAIDFAQHFKLNQRRYEKSYVMRLDTTVPNLLAFNQELQAITDSYRDEFLGLLAQQLNREQTEYPVVSATPTPNESAYWGVFDSVSLNTPPVLMEAAPPCDIHFSEMPATLRQLELISLGQQCRITPTTAGYTLQFRLQRGGVGSVLITTPSVCLALDAVWNVGNVLSRGSALWWQLVRDTIVVHGGCYPARHATVAPMQLDEHLQDVVLVRANRRPEFEPGFDMDAVWREGWIANPQAFFAALLACVMVDDRGVITGIDINKRIKLMDLAVMQKDAHGAVIGTRFFDKKRGETFASGVNWLGVECFAVERQQWEDVGCMTVRERWLAQLRAQGWISQRLYDYYATLSKKIGHAFSDIFYLPISARTRLQLAEHAAKIPTQHEITLRMRLLQPRDIELIALDSWDMMLPQEYDQHPSHQLSVLDKPTVGGIEVIFSPSGHAHGWRHLATSLLERHSAYQEAVVEPEEFSVSSVTQTLSRYLGDKRGGNRYLKGEDTLTDEVLVNELNYLVTAHEKLDVLNRLYSQHILPRSHTLYTHTIIGAGFFFDTNTHRAQLTRLRKLYCQIFEENKTDPLVVALVKHQLESHQCLLSTEEESLSAVRAEVLSVRP